MAEVMENNACHHKYASNAKGNAGLTLGIIGTSIAGLLALGAVGKGAGILNNNKESQIKNTCFDVNLGKYIVPKI